MLNIFVREQAIRKYFNNVNNGNLEHKVAQRILAENGSRRQIEWNHVFSVTTACWRGVAMRQGSLQRGGSILKKGVVGILPARKMAARSSYGGRYNRLHGSLGREDTCKDGSLEVLVPSRSL